MEIEDFPPLPTLLLAATQIPDFPTEKRWQIRKRADFPKKVLADFEKEKLPTVVLAKDDFPPLPTLLLAETQISDLPTKMRWQSIDYLIAFSMFAGQIE